MRQRTQRLSTVLLFLVDLTVICVSAALAVTLRNYLRKWLALDLRSPYEIATTLRNPYWLAAALWVLVLIVSGSYSRSNIGAGAREYAKVVQNSLVAAGMVGIACFLARYPMSRGFFVLAFGMGIPLLLVGRVALRRLTRYLHCHGKMLNRVLLAGDEDHIEEVVQVLEREKWLGYSVVGALLPRIQSGLTSCGIPVVGTVGGVSQAVEVHDADMVIFAEGSFRNSREFRRTAWQLEDMNTHMIVVPSLTDISAERIETRPIGGLPFVSVERPKAQEAGRLGKRLFDVVGSGILLLLSLPILLVTAVAIKLEDGGPLLFKQVRVGRNGQLFHCLKLRSMVPNAEELKRQMQSEVDGVLFKMRKDPRITRVGAVLRRYSIDELPQLWNVFRGDMSLVGPRPHLPNEVDRYEQDVIRRLSVRPGMSGLWQVSGRSNLPWPEAVRLDLFYVDNWSMLQDLSILAKTVKAVFGRSGAY